MVTTFCFIHIFFLFYFIDQAKQQRLEEARSLDETNFSTFELRQSRRGTMKSNRTTTIDRNTVDRDPAGHRDRGDRGDRDSRGTMRSTASRKSHTPNFAMINGARQPPRPTPSMVNYSDEDSAKGYDENPDDSDSLTEKPSEISSTDSQVSIFDRHGLNHEVYSTIKLYGLGIVDCPTVGQKIKKSPGQKNL